MIRALPVRPFLLAALLVAGAGARAQIGVPISDPVPLNTSAPTDHLGDPVIGDGAVVLATDRDGSWLAVWVANGVDYTSSPSETDLLFARSSDLGVTWTAPAILNANSSVDGAGDFDPHLAVDGLDVWITAWETSDTLGGFIGNDRDILYSRSLDGSLTWGYPVPLNSNASTDDENDADVRLAADDAGNWVAVWWSTGGLPGSGNDNEILVARSSDSGASWSAPQHVNTDATADTGNDRSPHVATSGNGLWLSVWTCHGCDGETDADIRFARSLSNGEFWTPPQWLNTDASSDTAIDEYPWVAVDGQNAVAVWWNRPSLTDYDGSILFSRSTNSGITWGAPQSISAHAVATFGGQVFPRVFTDGQGEWFAVWFSLEDPFGVAGADHDVYISRSIDAGLNWSAPQALNNNATTDSGHDTLTTMTTDGEGRWVTAWASQDTLGGTIGTDADVLTARFLDQRLRILDPNPELLDGSDVIDDPDVLAILPAREVWGLAADGVTRVVLRVEVPGPGDVTYRIEDENGLAVDVGTLSTPGGSEAMTTLTVPVSALVGGQYMAFAVLRAPEDFIRGVDDEPLDLRPIALEAEFDPADGSPHSMSSTEIWLTRPPVMLIHGLWSNNKTWGLFDGTGWSVRDDYRFVVYAQDYRTTNAEHFSVNVHEARAGVEAAVALLRDQGVAATQADVFGHSMGGMLTRLYVGDRNGDYLRDATFGEGDVNRLVTVDSPHTGSSWGNVIDNALTALGLIDPGFQGWVLQKARAKEFCLNCGAISDLRTDSVEITTLPAADVPAHAIVGVGGSELVGIVEDVGTFVSYTYALLRFLGVDLNAIFPEPEHDLIVGRISQTGGLGLGSRISEFEFVSFASGNLGIHTSVTSEPQTDARALELLDTPVTDSATFASGFPAAAARSSGTTGGQPDAAAAGATIAEGAAVGLTITQPAAGSHVTAGQTLNVTVVGTGGFVPEQVMVLSTHDAGVVSAAPFEVNLDIPLTASGTMVISAAGSDVADAYATATDVTVSIDVPATLNGLYVLQDPIHLFSYSPTRPIQVIGTYDDGVDRPLPSSGVGTAYAVDDPSVVAVDSEGNARAVSAGSSTVVITNGPFLTSVIVEVVNAPLTLLLDGTRLFWPPSADASGYDVVRGSLGLLRTDGFTASTAECLAPSTSELEVLHGSDPPVGEGYWHLARVVYPDARGKGSYAPDGLPDGGVRDGGISASGFDCP